MKTSAALFASVLCPVDFSSHARAALQYAALVARRGHGSITALFVSDPLLVEAAAAAAYDRRGLAQASERELQRFVGRTVGHLKGSSRLTCRHATGDPSTEILKAARATGADLIVLGTQGLSGASRMLFGSTTARLLARATVPVLAVPPQGRKPAAAGWPGRQVMATLDLGPEAARDAARATAVADWFDARLTLLHVVAPTQAPRWLPAGLRSHDHARLARARDRMTRICAGIERQRAVTAHVLAGRPADQIPAVAADSGAGLVVVTLRKGGGLFGRAQGSITYQVLSGITVPVLALPPTWRGTGR